MDWKSITVKRICKKHRTKMKFIKIMRIKIPYCEKCVNKVKIVVDRNMTLC